MPIYIRSTNFFYYRLFFVGLFMLLGIGCLAVVCLECFSDIRVLEESSQYHEALLSTLGVMGVLGLFTALIMLYLMQERRSTVSTDRRRRTEVVGFADRRVMADRRSQA